MLFQTKARYGFGGREWRGPLESAVRAMFHASDFVFENAQFRRID